MQENQELISRIAKLFLAERKRRNWTRAYLAERSGLSIQTIGNIEREEAKKMSIQTFQCLVKTLELQADYVLDSCKPEHPLIQKCQDLTDEQKECTLIFISTIERFKITRGNKS